MYQGKGVARVSLRKEEYAPKNGHAHNWEVK